jgi:hypothetical protein
MEEMQIPMNTINIVRAIIRNTKYEIRIQAMLSKPPFHKNGVKEIF